MSIPVTPELLARISQENLETLQVTDPNAGVDWVVAEELGIMRPEQLAELPIVPEAAMTDEEKAALPSAAVPTVKIEWINSDRAEDHESWAQILEERDRRIQAAGKVGPRLTSKAKNANESAHQRKARQQQLGAA